MPAGLLKLKVPNTLPSDGVNAVQFKVWQNTMIAYLEQEEANINFFPTNPYAVWEARNDHEDGMRICALHDDDEEKADIVHEHRDDDAGDDDLQRVRQRKEDKLKRSRNAQLSRFLQHIANYCHYSEQDDIVNNSTSLTWVWDYLKDHYNIATRGSKFLDIAAIKPKSGEVPMVFYKQVRARIRDNLRKKGSKQPYLGPDKELTEDETFTPTFDSKALSPSSCSTPSRSWIAGSLRRCRKTSAIG